VVYQVLRVQGSLRVELGEPYQGLMWEERQKLAIALSVYGYRRLGTEPDFTARDARTNRRVGHLIEGRWSEVR
jgi:hypothetical protein